MANAWPLQQALFTRLNDGLSAPVFDYVPNPRPVEYVTIGDDSSVDFSDKLKAGEEVTLIVDTWSTAYKGKKLVKQLQDQVKDLLHGQPLTIAGHTTISLWFDFAQTMLDEDGVTVHGVSRFRLTLMEN